ncbi:MAG: response regulator [SAR202 cluster bacterium]|nr:response regulator [SAR202 cluster bacterium]MDP6514320.1 response regulator [SAR202 cluster bacterium]MDP6713928.1 response regulator [SAR202 cluster bacterium]
MARVMIIDDSLSQRRDIRGILQGDGHDISEASDCSDALDIMEAEPPDCVVLGLMAANFDGMLALDALTEKMTSPNVTVLTCDNQVTAYEKYFMWGANNVLDQPPDPNALRQAVKESALAA